MEKTPPSIGLIGAGKVGLVLAAGLHTGGYRIASVWDPDPSACRRAEDLLSGVVVAQTPSDVAQLSQLILIAVPDDHLPGVVGALAASSDSWSDTCVVHVSGRYGTAVLTPFEDRGAHTAALHPAMAFTGDVVTELSRLSGARFALTSSTAAGTDAGRHLIDALGGVPIPVLEDERILYHAALAHGSNHIVTLVVQASLMLTRAGVSDPSAVLGPAMRAALDNALDRGASGASGPVVRGDVGTVREHLAVLERAVPEVVDTYREMTSAGSAIAFAAGRIDEHQRVEFVRVVAAT